MKSFDYILLIIVALYLVWKFVKKPQTAKKKESRPEIPDALRGRLKRALAVDNAPKGGIKHTIYTGLLEGKTPEQIIPELNAIQRRDRLPERSDSEWLDYIEFVKLQMREEGQ